MILSKNRQIYYVSNLCSRSMLFFRPLNVYVSIGCLSENLEGLMYGERGPYVGVNLLHNLDTKRPR